MRTYYQIGAELYTPHVVPVLNAKQYDTGRGVDITLTDCGAVVVPGSSETLRLYCQKPDGTVSYLPGTLNGNAVRVDFTNQLLAIDGTVECELQVGTGSDMVSTPVFRLNVLPSNIDDAAIESTDEFTALEEALDTVEQYDTRIDALETTAAGLKAASRYGVANNLTQATAGANVLDAYQGKVLNDRVKPAPFTTTGYLGSADDANTVTAGTFYASNATQNLPVSTGGFLMTLVRSDSSGKFQLFLPALSGYVNSIFKRQYVYTSSAWTDWVQINGTGTPNFSLMRYQSGTFTTSSLANQGDLEVPITCPEEFNGGACLLLLTRNGTYFTAMGATIANGAASCWVRNVSGAARSVTVGYVALMFK